MKNLRNNLLVRFGAFLLVAMLPPVAFIALLRIYSDPILSWIARYIRPYFGETITIAVFFLVSGLIALFLLLQGWGLAWRVVKPNLSELNGMIAASEEFLLRHPNDPYHLGRLARLEEEREQRFGVRVTKHGPNSGQ